MKEDDIAKLEIIELVCLMVEAKSAKDKQLVNDIASILREMEV